MRGFHVGITITDKPDNIRFRLYDNSELVVDSIGEMDFNYLTPSGYTGTHELTMTYYQDFDPSVESVATVVFNQDFTLPDLTFQAEVDILL